MRILIEKKVRFANAQIIFALEILLFAASYSSQIMSTAEYTYACVRATIKHLRVVKAFFRISHSCNEPFDVTLILVFI